jgi:hypothetical protein
MRPASPTKPTPSRPTLTDVLTTVDGRPSPQEACRSGALLALELAGLTPDQLARAAELPDEDLVTFARWATSRP